MDKGIKIFMVRGTILRLMVRFKHLIKTYSIKILLKYLVVLQLKK